MFENYVGLFFRHPCVDSFFEDDDLDYSFNANPSFAPIIADARTHQSLVKQSPQQQQDKATAEFLENEMEYKIHIDLPGVEVADVDISLVEKTYLVIQAERKYEYLYSEKQENKVQKQIRLPVNADADQANATFKNGVLTLTFPKKTLSSEGNVRKLSISTDDGHEHDETELEHKKQRKA